MISKHALPLSTKYCPIGIFSTSITATAFQVTCPVDWPLYL